MDQTDEGESNAKRSTEVSSKEYLSAGEDPYVIQLVPQKNPRVVVIVKRF